MECAAVLWPRGSPPADADRFRAVPRNDLGHGIGNAIDIAAQGSDIALGIADRSPTGRRPAAPEGQRTLEARRSEEHPSELQSRMRISYAVSCSKQKTIHNQEQ